MQSRTFSGENTAVVLAQIKEELGSDAVILETSNQDGMVVMTCAVESDEDVLLSSLDYNRGAGESVDSNSRPIVTGKEWKHEWDEIKGYLMMLMKPTLQLDKLPPKQRMALEYLQRDGVEDDVVVALIRKIHENGEPSILNALSRIVTIRPWGIEEWSSKVHLVTGPYGSGKTSNVIRMALYLRKLYQDLKICIINADSSRANGRLLLRHYCNLSGLENKDVPSLLDLPDVIHDAQAEGYEKILIDFHGLPRGQLLQKELEDIGVSKEDMAVHVSMAPIYGVEHAKLVLARYRVENEGSLIWTKLDEAEQFGMLINIAQYSKLPISALSFGPGMGSSLVPVQKQSLWKLLFKGEFA